VALAGKIFALTVDQAVRIRTGETDIAALRTLPHQALESAVFRELLSSAGTARQLDRLYSG
jgi:hypothetical protein